MHSKVQVLRPQTLSHSSLQKHVAAPAKRCHSLVTIGPAGKSTSRPTSCLHTASTPPSLSTTTEPVTCHMWTRQHTSPAESRAARPTNTSRGNFTSDATTEQDVSATTQLPHTQSALPRTRSALHHNVQATQKCCTPGWTQPVGGSTRM